jgi:polypeptide N-acetylgalactosaminyltransferase
MLLVVVLCSLKWAYAGIKVDFYAAPKLKGGNTMMENLTSHTAASTKGNKKYKTVKYSVKSPPLDKDIAVINSSGLSKVPGSDETHMHGILGLKSHKNHGWIGLPPLDLASETVEEKRVNHQGFSFNKRRSDGIPLDRETPDYRHPSCLALPQKSIDNLPNTSIIFVFYNEPLSTLYRSIHSVLNNSPPELIAEIILVDDGSDSEWLGRELENYIALLPKVVLLRMPKREGLMAARANGAKKASGDTLTFLDSHIEVNIGWLEPLMARISEDFHHVTMPFIDTIDADSFEVTKGGLDILGFTWTLGQKG